MVQVRVIGMLVVWMLAAYSRADNLEIYLDQIKPVFQERCYACHGVLKQKSGLRLDTTQFILSGGQNGGIINLNEPHRSELLQRLTTTDQNERMPPEGQPVDTEIVEAIKLWIKAGAPVPEEESPESDPANHWAFQAPVKPQITHRAQHPIDGLLAEHHASHDLRPQPLAKSRLLMRRLFLDLTGLPPSPEDISNYLKNPTDVEYSKIVDNLLASPHYAERWGRHWMDVWRYSDWFGLGAQLRYSQKHIWHWRDWILDSLNQDKGYDQMILEMLAADELYPLNQDKLRATGFLSRNYFLFNRTTWLDKTIEHTSKAFLGLTMQCSKCHDHKYDPISNKDYYRFRAIFEPHQIRTDALPGESNLEKNGIPRAFDMHPDEQTYIHLRGNEKDLDKSEVITPGPPRFLGNIPFAITPISLPPEAYNPSIREYFKDTLIREADEKIQTLEQAQQDQQILKGETDSLVLELKAAKLLPAAIRTKFHATRLKAVHPQAEKITELEQQAAKAEFEYEHAKLDWQISKGEFELGKAKESEKNKLEKKLEELKAEKIELRRLHEKNPLAFTPLRASVKALESPAETNDERYRPYPETTTGRRAALAHWITHPKNPLTARVAVNHMWMRHFGNPLVEPVTDFGLQTDIPKLHRVLDFLAVTFIENGWRMKPIHRLIVTSQAYKRSSSELNAYGNNLKTDPNNELLWRQNSVRMESQILRDSILHLAKQLNYQMGGPTIPPDQIDQDFRRSLYFTHSRDDQNKFLNAFDDASILACYRRTESVIPQQALALANSRLSMDAAVRISKVLNASISSNDSDHESFVKLAFESVLGWSPSKEEMETCLKQLKTWEKDMQVDKQPLSPRASLVHALLNHNDFATIR